MSSGVKGVNFLFIILLKLSLWEFLRSCDEHGVKGDLQQKSITGLINRNGVKSKTCSQHGVFCQILVWFVKNGYLRL